MSRREIRVAPGFFDQVDAQLGSDRGPNGEPSATDFIALDLPVIIGYVAEQFDDLPEVIDGVPAARMWVSTGVLVPMFVVYAVLSDDGVVDLIAITIEDLPGFTY